MSGERKKKVLPTLQLSPHGDSGEIKISIRKKGENSSKRSKAVNGRSSSEVVGGTSQRELSVRRKARTEVGSLGENEEILQHNLLLNAAKKKKKNGNKKASRFTSKGSDSSGVIVQTGTDSDVESVTISGSVHVEKNLRTLNRRRRRKSLEKLVKLPSNSSFSRHGSQRSHRESGYTGVIKRSLADMSQMVRKMSMTVGETEGSANEEADKLISDEIFSETNVTLQDLSATFVFVGRPYDDFDCFNKDKEYMLNYFVEAFSALELNVVYEEDASLVTRFLSTVLNKYKTKDLVPFHSFYHGFSVAQVAVSFVLRSPLLKRTFDRKTLFTFIIAAVSHDVDHPGNDNFYENISNSHRTEMYGKESPLENHHTNTTLQILKEDDGKCNVFKYLNQNSQEEAFSDIVGLILATDMKKHKQQHKFLENMTKNDLNNLNEEDQFLLLCVLMHACDLSGQCFSEELAKEWERNIYFEMLNQYHNLKKRNLEIPNHLKHIKGGEVTLKERYRSQADFMSKFLVPFWSEIVRLFPEMHDLLENLKRNQAYFAACAM